MRANINTLITLCLILLAFAWAWFSGETMEYDLVYLDEQGHPVLG